VDGPPYELKVSATFEAPDNERFERDISGEFPSFDEAVKFFTAFLDTMQEKGFKPLVKSIRIKKK